MQIISCDAQAPLVMSADLPSDVEIDDSFKLLASAECEAEPEEVEIEEPEFCSVEVPVEAKPPETAELDTVDDAETETISPENRPKSKPDLGSQLVGLSFQTTDLAGVMPDEPMVAFDVAMTEISPTKIEKPTMIAEQPAPRPTVEAQVAKQLSAAVSTSTDNVTEIALDPEELGRVKMQMVTKDDAIQIVISTERSETTDLMRKHLDLLKEEFRDLGFSSVDLSFTSEQHDGGASTQPDSFENQEPAEVAAPVGLTLVGDGRIDIRL